MNSADDALREFIRNYYYGEVSDETVAADADALIEHMRDQGWWFDRPPTTKTDHGAGR